jgi:hypothetical protein
MSTISTQPAAGGSGAHKPAKPKSKKDKSQKKAAQPAGAESANGGFSLLGADKDAELDDVFGKSVRTIRGIPSVRACSESRSLE